MVDTVMETLVKHLKDGGLNAIRQYPNRAFGPAKNSEIIVSLDEARCLSPGMGDYLGFSMGDPGEPEVYGKRMEMGIGLTAMVPFSQKDGAGSCIRLTDRLCEILAKAPDGIKITELARGEVKDDGESAAFVCKCKLKCMAFFVAEDNGDYGEFLDFVLRGRLKK